MNEFISWPTLATYGGALATVLILTQFTKGLGFVQKIPTQIWSYILALITLITAHAFTDGLTLNIIVQSLFNGVIISIAANGGFSVVQSIAGKATDGKLLVDTSDPEKDIYRLDVGTIEGLADKRTITLKVKAGKIYN